jgi:hypothetical protein
MAFLRALLLLLLTMGLLRLLARLGTGRIAGRDGAQGAGRQRDGDPRRGADPAEFEILEDDGKAGR